MEVNVVDAVLFTKPHLNVVVTFTLEIPKTLKKYYGTTLPRCGSKIHK